MFVFLWNQPLFQTTRAQLRIAAGLAPAGWMVGDKPPPYARPYNQLLSQPPLTPVRLRRISEEPTLQTSRQSIENPYYCRPSSGNGTSYMQKLHPAIHDALGCVTSVDAPAKYQSGRLYQLESIQRAAWAHDSGGFFPSTCLPTGGIVL